jgi:hypothetical protein
VTLDLGGGEFAHYLHLRPGTLRLNPRSCAPGPSVSQIGCSGDVVGPHLHLQATALSSGIVGGDGVPYVIDRYRVKLPDGTLQTRARELRLKGTLGKFDHAAVRAKPACQSLHHPLREASRLNLMSSHYWRRDRRVNVRGHDHRYLREMR